MSIIEWIKGKEVDEGNNHLRRESYKSQTAHDGQRRMDDANEENVHFSSFVMVDLLSVAVDGVSHEMLFCFGYPSVQKTRNCRISWYMHTTTHKKCHTLTHSKRLSTNTCSARSLAHQTFAAYAKANEPIRRARKGRSDHWTICYTYKM